MIVITLTKVPPSLRGDLTKWYQEIQTGVYVGNVSARVRDELWERILRDIGSGQATMAYNAQNELGYQFRTTKKSHEVVDYDGIPLLMRMNESNTLVKSGFSRAAKMHKARVSARRQGETKAPVVPKAWVSVDIETTGLKVLKDQIIAIGAVKQSTSETGEVFYRLIKSDVKIPDEIVKLTGITPELLRDEGVPIQSALTEFREFVLDLPIVGYNIRFDDEFISRELQQFGESSLSNRLVDLLAVVKRTNQFLDNYKLSTVLDEYEIEVKTHHNALADAQATRALAIKLIKNGALVL